MLQTLIAYAVVAVAAVWVVWHILMPASLRQRLRPGRGRQGTDDGCASGCGGCSGCPPSEQPVTLRTHPRDRS